MKRVLVVGCGGIGGNVAAGLSQHAPEVVREVVGLSTNADIARAVNEGGYRLKEAGGVRAVPGRIVTDLEPGDVFDWIVLATQPPQVEDAARRVGENLADAGAMVVMQNGLCEDRIAKIAGRERVVGAVVGWGATMHAPGLYERTSDGGFTIGVLPRPGQTSADDPRLADLAMILEIVGDVTVSANLAGARWSKLAFNCAISTLGTIGGDRLGALLRYQFVRRLALEVMSEVVAVANAEGVRLEKLAGTIDLDWLALTDAERRSSGSASLVAKHSLMLAVGTRYRNLRSSMLAAIERGRPPAVDFLNGEVVDRGRRYGLPTPVNALATDVVHAIARGERKSGVETLRWMYDQR